MHDVTAVRGGSARALGMVSEAPAMSEKTVSPG
jgi:hypothetical protein